jgi:hypothetical protein
MAAARGAFASERPLLSEIMYQIYLEYSRVVKGRAGANGRVHPKRHRYSICPEGGGGTFWMMPSFV